MLIIFVVTIFVLPKLCFFGVGLHPRLFRRHGPKEVAVRFCYRCVYSCIELVVCAFAFSSEVPYLPHISHISPTYLPLRLRLLERGGLILTLTEP